MFSLPDSFKKTIKQVHGSKGEEWLAAFHNRLRDCADRWSIQVSDEPFPLSYHFVVPAMRADGERMVLKLGVPDREWMFAMKMLNLVDGEGMVRLYEADPEQGAMLLERLEPGDPLSIVRDEEEAAGIASEVMRRLWVPEPSDCLFPHVADWAEGLKRLRRHFTGGTGPFSRHLVEAAERLVPELLGSVTRPLLLHGDLHHYNILLAGKGEWKAIDPKGVVGEAEFEPAVYLRNRMECSSHPMRALTIALDVFAERLGIQRDRMLAWGLFQSVLSAWWHVEGGTGGRDRAMECAECFYRAIR
ncbi:aminoglycoside phosphotransferase family protein [Desmospora profundinema]|uniref:Streptomycin 6-kinase n=1 Tax=Desmospora profundinema TaxID=1571184 RepID=A0ABU1IIU5_9BACL|nr:aminoglycoside phosphotransferase family protein [Desmospora profundinema]MDR6224094.1 streptomycin 6-kinase [Desmospora profundinema]